MYVGFSVRGVLFEQSHEMLTKLSSEKGGRLQSV